MDTLVTLYCLVDDFMQAFMPQWSKTLLTDRQQRHKPSRLSPSEVMTIIIHFHQSGYRNFKHYYLHHVRLHLSQDFPQLVSYARFVELMPSVLVPLTLFSQTLLGQKTGIYFVDSTVVRACHVKRERQHRVFAGLAAKIN